MPKDRRTRASLHSSSAKIKRTFAVQENAVQQVQIGSLENTTGNDILKSISAEEPPAVLSKKEKQNLKREALLQRGRSPYSKSHIRRMKRKVKEELAGGMNDIQVAIYEMDTYGSKTVSETGSFESAQGSKPASRPEAKAGKIGEGKGVPLSKTQRKQALELERLRHPLILSNSEFAANPFQTIRTHVRNTLIEHQPSS
ncbi:ribosome biogenesis protein SLX9-domain-containing protein [Cyathus striatus]|nr:ribosome biogenesis protein SLX9-domain-containing protein [Cyathus striatus]